MSVESTASAVAAAGSIVLAPAILTWAALLRDLVTTVAAGTAAWVAVQGLSAWKRQLKGQNEYELAKRILRLVYHYRDAISTVRNPVVLGVEMAQPLADESAAMSKSDRHMYGMRKAYEARWKRVADVRSNLYPELLEAEVIWGTELGELLKPLFGLEHRLAMGVRNELMTLDSSIPQARREQMFGGDKIEPRLDLVYSASSEDEFSTEFQAHVDLIGVLLQQHLGK